MDRENNHTASKNKQSKYGKLYFIEHSNEDLSTWIFYLNSHIRNMKLTHWAWAACGCKHNSARFDKWLEIVALEDLTPKKRRLELQESNEKDKCVHRADDIKPESE